jgi:predicted transcriptional regulator
MPRRWMFGSCPIPTQASRALSSYSELEAALARTMPVVLALLADGTPRSKRAIINELADRYDRKDVKHAVMRLSVTGRIVEHKGRFILAPDEGEEAPTAV